MSRKFRKLLVKLVLKVRRLKDFALHTDPVDAIVREVRKAGPEPGFQERVIVITGSSAGIGFVLAQAFLQKGARVVINGRRDEVLRAAAIRLGEPGRVLAVNADVSTPEGAQVLLDQSVAGFGRVDVLINNAAILGPKQRKFWEIEADDWTRAITANLSGPFFCAATFMRWMQKAKVNGRIINVSSGAANAPIEGLVPYAVSKSALDALTLNLAADADSSGVAVIGVQLGSTKTEMARSFFPWAEYELLPPPETLAPVFWYLTTADAGLLHGRILAAWRCLMAQDAEARIAMPMSVVGRFRFVEQRVPERIPQTERIVLNRAENQLGTPARVKALMSNDGTVPDVSRYPDPDYGGLRTKLAAKHGLDKDCFSIGNGSAELVERVLRVFVKPGEAVLSNDPSWFMFDRFAHVRGVRNDKVPFIESAGEGFDHNLEGILAAIRGDTRLIYLIHPSNPVGVPILHAPFAHFLEQVPRHIPVVIDEAYVDFCDRSDTVDVTKLVRDSDHMLISLRTFSKFFGLAGMRVGYAFAKRTTISLLDCGELLFPISSFAAEAASAALDDMEHARRTAENCSGERRRIMQFLSRLGIAYVPTQSSMLMFEPPCVPDTLFDRLQERGIVPARGTVFGRFALWPVGLPAQNERFMEVVSSCQ